MELQPFVNSDRPVILSSAFLYTATQLNVKTPIHDVWAWDRHIDGGPEAGLRAMLQLRPTKMVLTQFDYYRGIFTPVIEQLSHHPEFVTIRIKNNARIPTPDSIPSLQRVIQHISWAPVIIDLDWK